jgi:hypothetical protein
MCRMNPAQLIKGGFATEWTVCEYFIDKPTVRQWILHIVRDRGLPNSKAEPFARGHWFFGTKNGDPAGYRLYLEAVLRAEQKVAEFNAMQNEEPDDRPARTVPSRQTTTSRATQI